VNDGGMSNQLKLLRDGWDDGGGLASLRREAMPPSMTLNASEGSSSRNSFWDSQLTRC